MSLLPSRDPAAPDADPRVIAVDSEDADDVLGALSSGTARELLASLHEEPAPPGELADRVDTSLQNAQYHLEKLEKAGAVAVVDTAYSQKGREMDVYAPANEPLVICAGDERETSGLRQALRNVLGGFGALALGSALVQEVVGGGLSALWEPRTRSASAGGARPDVNYLPNGTEGARLTEVATRTVADGAGATEAAAHGLPPGLVFFAGGAVVLLGLLAVSYRAR